MLKAKRKHSAILGVLMSVCCAAPTFAAEVFPIDLQTAVDMAFASNPNIRIAEYNLKSSKATYNAARESRGISVSLSQRTRRGGYYDSIAWAAAGGINNSYSSGITASLPIFTGGKLQGNVDKARAGYEISALGERKTYNDLKDDTTVGYYNLLAATNARDLSRDSVNRLEEHLKNVQAQYDVGVVAKVDVLRSEVELTNAQQTLIKAQNTVDLAEANLNNIICLPQDTTLQPKEELTYEAYPAELNDCIAYALEHRTDLQQVEKQVEIAKANVKIAKAGHLPQVAATAANAWSDGHWPADDNRNWVVGFDITMNVFDTGVTLSQINGARADLKAAEETYKQAQDTIQLDVRNNYYNLREAEKRIHTTQVAVAKAEEDYSIAVVRYQAGVGTNTDVLDAQVALTQAKNNFNTALYDYNTSKSGLITAMGIEAKPEVPVTRPVITPIEE